MRQLFPQQNIDLAAERWAEKYSGDDFLQKKT